MTQLASKLKKGDEVVVIAGKDKGTTGKIERVITATNRVVVSGANMVTKHIGQRKAMMMQREPGKEASEASIHVSNVMLKDPKTGKPTRVGYKLDKDGNKVRFAKASGETLNVVSKAKTTAKPAAKKAKGSK